MRRWIRFSIVTLLSFVLSCVADDAHADYNVDPAVTINTQKVTEECGDAVTRIDNDLALGEDLAIPTSAGVIRLISTRDCEEDPNECRKYRLEKCDKTLGLIFVRIQHFELLTLLAIDPIGGRRFHVAGPVHPSPSGRSLVVVEPYPAGGERWGLGITILDRLEDGAWKFVWRARANDIEFLYNSAFVRWEDEKTIRILTSSGYRPRDHFLMGYYSVIRVAGEATVMEAEPEIAIADCTGLKAELAPSEIGAFEAVTSVADYCPKTR